MMDPHTARCLQLSTSISMPFNTYRPHRFPDPFNRSRYPVNNPVPQMRPMPNRPPQPEVWISPTNNPMYNKHPYTPCVTPQGGYVQRPQSQVVEHRGCAPTPSESEASYFPSSLTPMEDISNDPWDEALKHTDFADATISSEGLGLSLADFDNDFSLSEVSINSTENYGYQAGLKNVEALVSDPASPDRQSWSSISESSGELDSDFPDLSTPSELSVLNSDVSSSLGFPFNFEDSTSDLVQHSLGQTGSQLVSRSSPRHRVRAAPYSVNRKRSATTSSLPLLKTQNMSNAAMSSIEYTHQTPVFACSSASVTLKNVFEPTGCASNDCFHTHGTVSKSQFSHDSLFLPPRFETSLHHVEDASVLPSSGFLSMLNDHSPIEDSCENHFAEFSEPPDLFRPLQEEPLSPTVDENEAEDSDLTPRKQDLRFDGDLYTPKYVRGHGNKREGWCGVCKPGRWLVLKNSAFWYDKSFSHGICASTGAAFEGPKETRRMAGNPDVWEGLCHSCGDWIALISSKKKGTTWFRHAYKCHTHQKVKDTPKRRREPSQSRGHKTAKATKAEEGVREDSPLSLTAPMTELKEEEEENESAAKAVSALQTISSMI